MADNAAIKSDASATVFTAACDELTYSGDTAKVQLVRLVHVAGAEGSKTLTEIADTTGVKVHQVPTTTGGHSTFHLVAAATDNATNIKASAGQLYGAHVFNVGAVPLYVKFHNTAGAPTAGAGVVRTLGCQAGLNADLVIPNGAAFSAGLAITIVAGIADNNAGAVGAAACVVDVEFT